MKQEVELRCDAHKHGELVDGAIEVRCRKPACGYASGILVIHRFDLDTGCLVETRRFREPPGKSKKEG